MDSDDPLHTIARRLFPLVRSRPDWWREAVRRWASDPPRHSVESPLINTKELRERLHAESKKRGKRGKNQSDDDWTRRQKNLKEQRERAKQLLGKLRKLGDGAPILDDENFQILPVPFTDETTTEDERIALLAAIHDTFATVDARIDPWADATISSKAEIAMFTAWGVLLSDRVPKLREHWDTHQAAVEMFLADALRDAPKGSKFKKRGRKKADYKTQQSEAKVAADWKKARDAGTSKRDFAKDSDMTFKKLDRLLDRVAWRERSSE